MNTYERLVATLDQAYTDSPGELHDVTHAVHVYRNPSTAAFHVITHTAQYTVTAATSSPEVNRLLNQYPLTKFTTEQGTTINL